MQIVNVRLPVELVESMDGLAADRGGQRSELIRAALAQYLERETGPVPGAEAEYALEVLQRVVRRNNAA